MTEQHEVEQQADQPVMSAGSRSPTEKSNGKEAATEQPKARSGYGRLRNRHRALIAEKESLEIEYHAVRQELVQWRSMYLELKADLEPLVATPGGARHG